MQNRALLLGHRGARRVKAIFENTLPAFDLALARGCDGFEFDVRLSVDGQAVVCHDPKIHGIEIARSPAQQLALPMLLDVLARYQNTAFLDLELKVPGVERITIDLLREHTPSRGFVVSSFLPEVLQSIHETDPTIPLGLICETRVQLNLWASLPVVYVIPHFKLLREDLIRKIKSAGRKIFVWTVNTSVGIKRFADWGVDGIVSDYPERLAIALGRDTESKNQ